MELFVNISKKPGIAISPPRKSFLTKKSIYFEATDVMFQAPELLHSRDKNIYNNLTSIDGLSLMICTSICHQECSKSSPNELITSLASHG